MAASESSGASSPKGSSARARHGMRPEDIGLVRQAGDPRVSPDGTTVAFTVAAVDLGENLYRSRIWLGPADASAASRPFTAGPHDALPRWSPDGRWLACVANAPDAPTELCVLPVDRAGERVVVATWPAPVTELSWSPDGSQLAFVARDPDPERYGTPGQPRKPKDIPPRRITRFFSRLDSEGFVVDRQSRVVVVAADGSSDPLVLTDGPYEARGAAWSPDGTRIAFSSARHETWDLDLAVDLWSVAADGESEPERLTETDASYAMPAFSPDGSRIAYLRNEGLFDEPRHDRLGVLDLQSGQHVEISLDLDRNFAPFASARAPVWVGDHLLCSVEDEGDVGLTVTPADGSAEPRRVVAGERWVGAWDWAGGTLAMAVTAPTELPELVVTSFEGRDTGPEHHLTHLTTAFTRSVRLVEPVAYIARSADGTEVPCWAMAPLDAGEGERRPTLLNVHGGPFTSYGNRFFDEFQFQAAAGYGVVYCNPRGSSGYTEAWGRAVRWPESELDPGSGWGGVDFDDVMACVEEACRRFDWVDPDRLGILGGSYGGFMTSWAIGHTDRFKAACSERACNNLLSLEISSDIGTAFRGYVGRSHLDAPEAYLRQSPISAVRQMTTPVLILHSEDDLRCPINQAEELFVALRLLGREPVMVRVPGESHELSRSGAPKHRVQRAELILDWFREHLASG